MADTGSTAGGRHRPRRSRLTRNRGLLLLLVGSVLGTACGVSASKVDTAGPTVSVTTSAPSTTGSTTASPSTTASTTTPSSTTVATTAATVAPTLVAPTTAGPATTTTVAAGPLGEGGVTPHGLTEATFAGNLVSKAHLTTPQAACVTKAVWTALSGAQIDQLYSAVAATDIPLSVQHQFTSFVAVCIHAG